MRRILSVALVALLGAALAMDALAQNRFRGRCIFVADTQFDRVEPVNNDDPHFCGPITRLLFGRSYVREMGWSAASLGKASVETKDNCAFGARSGYVVLSSKVTASLRHVRRCEAPHPEFFDVYTSQARGVAELESAPGNAIAQVEYKVATTLLEDDYTDGQAVTSSVRAFPVAVGKKEGVQVGLEIPVQEGEMAAPFVESGGKRSMLAHVPEVEGTLIGSVLAASTSKATLLDPSAKANAKSTIERMEYRIFGTCGNCNARDELIVTYRATEGL